MSLSKTTRGVLPCILLPPSTRFILEEAVMESWRIGHARARDTCRIFLDRGRSCTIVVGPALPLALAWAALRVGHARRWDCHCHHCQPQYNHYGHPTLQALPHPCRDHLSFPHDGGDRNAPPPHGDLLDWQSGT